MGHTTHQRLVLRQDLRLPSATPAVSEVSVDGGKVRLRGEPKQGCHWRDYKAVRLQGIYYGAVFDDNQCLIDYVNSQPLTNPLVCLGDGHGGVWNLIKELVTPQARWEILDWYHLKENLYKVGGSLKRLKQAEALLWQGQVEAATGLFTDCRNKQAKNFCTYLNQHRCSDCQLQLKPAPNKYALSAQALWSRQFPQIGSRVKISGAQWKIEHVFFRCFRYVALILMGY